MLHNEANNQPPHFLKTPLHIRVIIALMNFTAPAHVFATLLSLHYHYYHSEIENGC